MYNPVKAAQVIAYFALLCKNRSIPILKAMKLVYLSDRESVKKWGFPILDEVRVSMPLGPVNSTTYSHINGEYDLEECGWSEYLTDRDNHEVSANDSISVDDLEELSDADVECLDIVWASFGSMSKWEIKDWTHDPKNVPEWEDPDGGSIPIPLERMMKYLGVKNVEDQIKVIEEHKEIDRLFDAISESPKYTM